MALKLDLEKAYDKLKWHFVSSILSFSVSLSMGLLGHLFDLYEYLAQWQPLCILYSES